MIVSFILGTIIFKLGIYKRNVFLSQITSPNDKRNEEINDKVLLNIKHKYNNT